MIGIMACSLKDTCITAATLQLDFLNIWNTFLYTVFSIVLPQNFGILQDDKKNVQKILSVFCNVHLDKILNLYTQFLLGIQ